MTNEEAIRLVDDRMCYGRGKWSKHHQPVIDEYWQAGEMAIKALEAELHWIPVTERLPKMGREILFCDIDGDIFVGHRAIEHWWSVDDKVKNVIAWCELPEPYKEVTE